MWTPIATGDSPQLGQLQAACAPGAPFESDAEHAAVAGGPDLDRMRAAAFEKQVGLLEVPASLCSITRRRLSVESSADKAVLTADIMVEVGGLVAC